MPSSQIPHKPLVHPNWQLPTQSFTLINTILAYTPAPQVPYSPTEVATPPEVATSPTPIDEPTPTPTPVPAPAPAPLAGRLPLGCFIDLTNEDSVISSNNSKY